MEAAFEELYRKYRDRVFNLACRVLNDRGQAADATQETFLTLMRKARRFNFRSAFTSWLYRVTVNQCLDHRRRRSWRKSISLSVPEVAARAETEDSRSDTPEMPEDAAARAEFAAEVRAAIARLNPKLSVVVILRYTEGLGYEEIAGTLGLPLGTVKSRLSRAHAALEEDLGSKLDQYL